MVGSKLCILTIVLLISMHWFAAKSLHAKCLSQLYLLSMTNVELYNIFRTK